METKVEHAESIEETITDRIAQEKQMATKDETKETSAPIGPDCAVNTEYSTNESPEETEQIINKP